MDIKNELMNFAEDYKKEMSANAYEFVGQMVQSIEHDEKEICVVEGCEEEQKCSCCHKCQEHHDEAVGNT